MKAGMKNIPGNATILRQASLVKITMRMIKSSHFCKHYSARLVKNYSV
jgi:hypothetical protein